MSRVYLSRATKRFVRVRANGCCEYCQSLESFSSYTFAIEHIIPLALEGTNELDNLALSCQGCNSHKHTKTSVFDDTENDWIRLFHPRSDNWTDHFQWNEDFTLVIAITTIGRVTLNTLRLNRPHLLNLRMATFLMDEHPPIHTIV